MAAIKTLSVILTANATQLSAGLKAASAQLTAFDRSITTAAATTGRLSSASSTTTGAVTRLGPAARTSAAAVTRLGQVSATSATAVARLGTASGVAATNLARLGTASNAAAGGIGRLNGVTTAAAASQARLGTASAAAAAGTSRLGAAGAAGAAATSRLGAASAGAAAGTTRLGSSSASTGTVVSRLGQAAGTAGGDTGRLGRAAGQGAAAVSILGTSAQAAAKGGVFVLGVALAAAVAGAVSFEAKMKNVASIDKHVEQNFKATSQAVLDMSKHLPQSAATLADGLYNVAGSGFYGADAMNILEVSARAASAGLTDTNTASKAIVASLNAYGVGADQATRVSDALFSTVNYGVISFEALTGAIANSVGNAAKAGVDIEQLGSALATMTLSGMTASNAGVSLNNMISKLVKPSKALSQAAVQLGINLKADLANPAIGLYGVMGKLQEASQGNVTTLLKWFPEIRAARGAMALMAGDGANYTRVISEMGNAQLTAGETARVFGVQAGTAKFQLQTLGNQVVANGIEIGQRFLPYVGDAAGELSKLGSAAKTNARELGSAFGPAVEKVRSTLENLGDAAGDVWDAFGPLVDLAAKLGLTALVAGLTAVGAAASATTGFLSDHETVLYGVIAAYAAWKIPALIAGLTALGASLRLITAGLGFLAVRAYTDALTALQTRLTLFGTSWAAMGAAAGLYGAAIGAAAIALDTSAHSAERARKSVAALVGEIDRNNIGQLETAIAKVNERLVELGSNNDFGVMGAWAKAAAQGGKAGAEQAAVVKALGEEHSKLVAELEAARQKQQDMAANTRSLALAFGMSESAVKLLADRYEIDLSGSMQDAEDGTAGLTTQMEAARQTAANSIPDIYGNAEALDALGEDASKAETQLKLLTDQFDRLSGRLIDGAISTANMNIAFLELASGASLAKDANGQVTTSLDASTIAGNENRKMLNGLLEQVGANAKTQFDAARATGDVDAATRAYSETLSAGVESFRKFALQAGFTSEQINMIIEAANLMPENLEVPVSAPGAAEAARQMYDLYVNFGILPGSMEVPTSTPGATESANQVWDLYTTFGILPGSMEIPVTTPGATEAAGETKALDEAVNRLLPQWNTYINVPGAVGAKLDAERLKAVLDKLPPELATKIMTPGATLSEGEIYALKHAMDLVERELRIPTSTPGATESSAQVKGLYSNLLLLPDSVKVPTSTPGATDATNQIIGLKSQLNGLPSGRVVNVTYRETRVKGPTTVAAAATGGRMVGPGTGTSDSIPAMVSNGEWVIRERAAAQYGPAAMAAVNDGRARIVVPEGYAAGGPVRPAAARTAPVAGTSAAAGSGTTGAIAQIASGATELADVYQATTRGVIGTARALRDVVPRMWRADQSSTSLATSTGAADGQMGQWLDTILRTTGGVDEHTVSLVAAGRQIAGMTATELPGIIAATRTSTTATDAATVASRVWTLATDVARVAVGAATQGTTVHTEASRVLTTATELGTGGLRVATEATRTQTTATGQETAATRTQTTATGQQTTATNTGRVATTAFSGVVRAASADLGTNAAAARTAAAAVREYTAAVNSIPAARSTTVTTNYVTTGTPGGGYAGGGRIYGPGTGTSDSVPIMASRDEWIIRAAAARRYGTSAMAAVNAGTARIVTGSAQGFASGGLVGGYAQGGMVRGAWSPSGGGTTVNISAPVTLTIQGGDNRAATVRAAEQAAQMVVDRSFGKLATAIGARPGRGRG